MKNKSGITLIALIITIIIMLILVGVTVTVTLNGGLFEKTKLADFLTEMQKIRELVQTRKGFHAVVIITDGSEELFRENIKDNPIEIPDTLKQEILYAREGYPSDREIKDMDLESFIPDESMYIVDKEYANNKEYTYIYDIRTDVVFKIPQTKIGRKIYHSYECASMVKGNGGTGKDLIITKESEVVQVGEEYYYAPNLKGFNSKSTSVVYYLEDLSATKEINIKEYIENGEQNQIQENGTTYILHDYGAKKWANIKTTAHEKEAWWVWIPRYAYKIDSTNEKIEVIFIGTDNKPLNPKHNGVLPEGYEPHSGFTVEGKELKGIWMSKYEPSYKRQETVSGVLAPDMTGFDSENTYIELYDSTTGTFTQEVKLADANLDTINQKNEWYDYQNKIWANIKTTANNQEAWWVWIPRYAYKITDITNTQDIDIIFVDTSNRPLNTDEYPNGLPSGYEIHPAFTVEGKELKGIWMSKYEPSKK